MERVLEQPPGVLEAEASNPRALVTQLEAEVVEGGGSVEGRAAASRLRVVLEALAKREPTRATHELLQRLLDGKQLDDLIDSDGFSCRAALVGAQLSLGYPFALEISPGDLLLFRQAAAVSPPGAVGRVLIGLFGSLSLLWNGGVAAMLVAAARSEGPGMLALLLLPFLIGAGHAIASLVIASGAANQGTVKERRRAAGALKILGAMIAVGPIASGIAEVGFHQGGFMIGMIFASPAMVTALCCLLVGAQVTPPPPSEP